MPNDLRRKRPEHDEPADQEAVPVGERRRWQESLEQCKQLMQQRSYDGDRVHRLLTECVANDPGNFVYVDTLLTNLRRWQESGQPASPPTPPPEVEAFRQAAAGSDWSRVLRLGPDALKHDPHDTNTLSGLARACASRGYHAVELRYLQSALEVRPDDLDLNRHLARSYARVGLFDEAIERWRRIESLDPYDAEGARMISELTLEKLRHHKPDQDDGHGEDKEAEAAVGKMDAADLAEHAPTPPKPPRKLVLTRRQQLEQAILNNPVDETNYLELADVYLAEHRTFDAQRTLRRAIDAIHEPVVLERFEDVNMLRARDQVRIAETRAAEDKTQEAHDLVHKLRDELHRLELEVYRARCERHPNDPRVKFQFGVRLKQVGQIRQALEPLQAGLEAPEFRAAASLEIGEILQRSHQYPKALQCYRQAAQLAAGDEKQLDCRKRALYRAGVLAASMKLADSARQYLTELVKVAPGFRDAQDRLDKLTEIGQDIGLE